MIEYRTRLYRDGDEAGILQGFREAFGRRHTLEEWAWRYRFPGEDVSIAVAEDLSGRIVSHFAVLPVPFRIDGQPVRTGQGVDLFCLQRPGTVQFRVRTRTFNEFVRHYAGTGQRFQWIYGFPNQRALVGGQRWMGYSKEPPLVPVWTIKVRNIWESRMRRLWRVSWHPADGECRPSSLQRLWDRSSHRYPVSIVRDGAWLERRYLRRPGAPYVQRLVQREGEPRAWGVFRPFRSLLRWVDLLWDGANRGDLLALEEEARRVALGTGVSTIELWLMGDPEAADVLAGRGWTMRRDPTLRLTYRVFDESIGPGASLAERFYLTMGASDLD